MFFLFFVLTYYKLLISNIYLLFGGFRYLAGGYGTAASDGEDEEEEEEEDEDADESLLLP